MEGDRAYIAPLQVAPMYTFPQSEKTGWDRYFPEGKGYDLPKGHGDVAMAFQVFMDNRIPSKLKK
jgi:hypothetical protein